MLEDNFANWQNSAVRRRIQAKEMFETVDNLGNNVIGKICTLLGQDVKKDEKKRFFNNLRNVTLFKPTNEKFSRFIFAIFLMYIYFK